MNADIISVPAKLDTLAALRVASDIENAAANGDVTIDFARLEIPEPFAMLHLACAARDQRERGKKFTILNGDPNSYAARMGLLGEFDARYERTEHGASENGRFMAIRALSRGELHQTAKEINAAYVADAIEVISLKLGCILTQDASPVLTYALSYCLREIVRNAYEHGEADEILVCAQYRPAADRVDLAIADRGRGILRTLRRNRRIKIDTAMEAVKVALLPGISGVPVSRSDEANPWANSGYGLFMTHRICREGGVFTICSGDALIRLTSNRKIERVSMPVGTVIGLTVRLDLLCRLDRAALRRISAEGERIAKSLRNATVTASMASTSLRMSVES